MPRTQNRGNPKPVTLYYLETDDDFFEFQATTDANVQLRSTISSNPVQNISSVSDNVFSQQATITLRGGLSPLVRASSFSEGQAFKTPQEYIEGIKKIRDSKQIVTVHLANNEIFQDCLIENINYSANSKNYLGYSVTLTLKQIQVASTVSGIGRFIDIPAEVDAEAAGDGTTTTDETVQEATQVDISKQTRSNLQDSGVVEQ